MDGKPALYWYRGEVRRVVDGDTLDLELDLGCRVRHRVRARLKGVDCPEMPTEEGIRAREFVVSWLAEREMSSLWFHTHMDKSDKYGRLLVEVYDAGMLGLVNALVEHGHVKGTAVQ